MTDTRDTAATDHERRPRSPAVRPPARRRGRRQALRRRRRAALRLACRSVPARSTRSWAPTAPARARSSRSSPAPSGPTAARSPSADARTAPARRPRPAGGVVSVYQEPALIPDLDVRSNLRLTAAPRRGGPPLARASWACPTSTSPTLVRDLPLATLRVIDLARALAIEPDVLMLDEMTAALPANLTERVLEVIGRASAAPIAPSSSSRTG